MNVLTVLENETELTPMTQMISTLAPDADLMCFGSSLPALAAAREHQVDVALIDAELPELSGLDFGRYLQELYPSVNLIYLSRSEASGYEALRQHASGILPKPFAEKELRRELEELRFPPSDKTAKRLFAQTFGNFELFVDGKPVVFKYSKTKEIVAPRPPTEKSLPLSGRTTATPKRRARTFPTCARICRTPSPSSSSAA